MVQIIDLTSSPPPRPVEKSYSPTGKRVPTNVATEEDEHSGTDESESEEDEEQEPLEVLVPTLEELASVYPNHSDLYAHLTTLPRPLLSTMLMAHLPDPQHQKREKSRSKSVPASNVQPKVVTSSSLAHCVYCHKIYDKCHNDRGCAIKHWGDFDDEVFTCCGLYVYWESDNAARPPPEVDQPFCYRGPHHDRLVEDYNDNSPSWWKDWEDSGNTCEDKNCEEELKRFAGIKKDKKGGLKRARK